MEWWFREWADDPACCDLLSSLESTTSGCASLSIVKWCELAGAHGATGAAHGQALAEWSPPQPVTQHLWTKKHSAPLLHLPRLNRWQISWPALWVARSGWWELPAGMMLVGVVPAGVVVGLLGTGYCRARKGWYVTHYTRMSSLSISQRSVCSLSLITTYRKILSYLRAAAVEYAVKSWQMMF